MRLAILATLTFLLLTTTSFAAEQGKGKNQARSYISGSTCGQVTAGLKKQENRKQLALMVGSFVSGTNYAKNRDSKIELKNMLIVTERFCSQFPNKPFIAALVNLDRMIDKQIELAKQK